MYAHLLEADAWTGSAVVTQRVGTITFVSRASDTPAHTLYDGRISDAGSINRTLLSGGRIGRATVSYGYIELANPDGGLDPWIDYGFDGHAFTLRGLASRELSLSSTTTLFRGTLSGLDASDALNSIRLTARDRLGELAVPLLTQRYTGQTVAGIVSPTSSTPNMAEGDLDLKDQFKPRVFGAVVNVPGRMANRFNLLWQFSSAAVSSIIVYDGGDPLTNAGNFADLAALINATLVPGQYGTCLAQGIARLGGSPILTVTADVTDGATLADRSAARVAGRILDAMGVSSTDRDAASFDAVHTFNPAEVGIYLDSDTTALDVLSQVLDSIGAAIAPTALGVYQLIAINEPSGTPVATLTIRDIIEGGAFTLGVSAGQDRDNPAVWSVEVSWGVVYQPMSASELAGAVSLERKTYLASASRQAIASDATIKTKHPLASSLKVQSLLSSQAAAEAEAARLLELYGMRRDVLRLPMDYEEGRLYDIGALISVKINRFGYNAGKLFLVIGREDDFSENVTTLELWG
jgi:hypothetical protein